MSEKLTTFNEYLFQREKEWPDVVAMKQPIDGVWHDFTWEKTMHQARIMVTFLKSLGLKKGDKVSILSKNCAEWIIADFAISMAGLVLVPFFPNQHPDAVSYILDHADVKAIFVGKLDNWKIYDAILPEHIVRIDFPYKDPMPAQYHWNDILKSGKPDETNYIPDLEDTYCIIYTSGTTGNPKGVVMTHKSVAHLIIIQCEEREASPDLIVEHSHALAISPFGHIMGQLAVFGLPQTRATLWFVESIETFMDNLKDCQPTLFATVPRMWTMFQMGVLANIPQNRLDLILKIPILNKIIKKKIKTNLGLSRVTRAVSGAAPISQELVDWYDKLDITIVEGYGQTENLAIASVGRPGEHKVGSAGKPLCNVEIKISDEGEILTKSGAIMAGYYKDPEATKEAFTADGFLHTGDMGYIDEDGYLFIKGRFKDPFKTDKGEFINPVPIEAAFGSNTAIEQLCLIGISLVQPVLLVVLSESAIKKDRESIKSSLKNTLEKINKNLTPFQKVSHIIVCKEAWTPENDLMTPSLKVKRNEVHDKYIKLAKEVSQEGATVVWEDEV